MPYLSPRNLERLGGWNPLARRRLSRKVPTVYSESHMSSCLLGEQNDLGPLLSTCITGKQPATNTSAAALSSLVLCFDTMHSAARLLRACSWAIRCLYAELFTFSLSENRRGGANKVFQKFLAWWAGITRSLMFATCLRCLRSVLRKGAQIESSIDS